LFDPTIQHLQQLRPELQLPAIYLINAARQVGVPLLIVSGLRTEQHNASVGGVPSSWHLQGLAFDVGIQGYQWRQVPDWWWASLGQFGEQLGLRWGGRFSAYDPIHFDLPMQFGQGVHAI
jgi:hypothetical protein